MDRWLSLAARRYLVGFAIVDLLRSFNLHFTEHLLQMRREVKVRVDGGSVKICPMHFARRTSG